SMCIKTSKINAHSLHDALPIYHLNGAEALWYARARDNSTDFDRGRRQQQILRAVWRKARDSGLLANLPALWNQAVPLVETNLGLDRKSTRLNSSHVKISYAVFC